MKEDGCIATVADSYKCCSSHQPILRSDPTLSMRMCLDGIQRMERKGAFADQTKYLRLL